ncbi:MAG: hypothetical protein KC620_23980 [Myxococcales bacterium]|nr:hypothetical protein [Myxococcales bacterium]
MDAAPPKMHPTTWSVLRALRAGARLSRNRHFYLFEDPRARRAIKLHRFLASVERDVRARAGELSVSIVDDAGHAGQYALRLDFPTLHGRRTVFLTQAELKLLGEQAPEIGALLSARLDDG